MARPKKELISFDEFTIYACPQCDEPQKTENELLTHLKECLTCPVCEGEGKVNHSRVCSACKGVDGLEIESCNACNGTGLTKNATKSMGVSPKAVERLLNYPTYRGYKIAMGRRRR
jgi:hypothetical protein